MIQHDFKNLKIKEPKMNRFDYIGMAVLILVFWGLTYWMFILASNP